jgi:hypothetical protein
MLNYVSYEKIIDKILLALISFVVFGFIYTTMNMPYDEEKGDKLSNSMLYSFGIQCFKFDYTDLHGWVLYLVIMQIIISYIILVL